MKMSGSVSKHRPDICLNRGSCVCRNIDLEW